MVHESKRDFEAGQFEASRTTDPPADGIELLQSRARGSFTSPAIGVDEGFQSAVLSVNFTSGPAPTLGVVGLVSARTAQGWSPWFRLLRWGTPVFKTGQIEAVVGRVDVDLLQLSEPSHEVKYSVAWQAADPACRLRRVALSLAGKAAPGGSPAPAPSGLCLDVPFLSQWDAADHPAGRVCSPACLAMVASFYGTPVSVDQVANLAFDPDHGLYGNWSANVLAMSLLGFRAVVERAADLRALDAALQAGQPVITSIAFLDGELKHAPLPNTNGHLVVVSGITDSGDYLVRDPAARGQDDWREYSRLEFGRAWLGHGGVSYRIQREQKR